MNPVGVWPCYKYGDAPRAIDFLCNVLGFTVSARYDDPEDASIVSHAELRWPAGGGIMLGSTRAGNADLALSSSAYVVADDVEAIYQRCVDAGARIVREPYYTDYGSRDFTVADPEGIEWSFGSYPGHEG